jgi:hypothetical protein
MMVNATYCCLMAFLALYNKVVMMMLPKEEKERLKEYSRG